MPRGTNAPKLCPAEPAEADVDRAVGQAVAALAPGDLVAEHRADGAVDVADRQLELHRLPVARGGRLQRDELQVERAVEAVVLRPAVEQRLAVGVVGHVRGSA